MIKNIKEAKKLILKYYKNKTELLEAIKENYVELGLSEIAEDNKDKSKADLLKWFGEDNNENYTNIIVQEYGFPNDNLLDAIKQGQLFKNIEILIKAVEELENK